MTKRENFILYIRYTIKKIHFFAVTSSTARDSLKPGCFYIRKFCRNIRTKPFLLQNPLKTSSHIEKRRFSAEIRCKRPSYTKRSGISAPRSSHRLFSAGNTLNISRDPVKISPYIFYFSKKCVILPKRPFQHLPGGKK